MRTLPRANSRIIVKCLVTGIIVAYVIFSFSNLHAAVLGHWQFGYVAFVFWLFLAIGLFTMSNIARMVAVVIHWVFFFVIPVGLLSPFAAMDGLWGRNPRLWIALPVTLAIGFVNVLIIYGLGKAKMDFKDLSKP
jgi:FtsH-binding integral membrane protein